MTILSIHIVGETPQPGGSKRAFRHATTGRVVVLEDCRRNRTWRQAVQAAALEVKPLGSDPLQGPLYLRIEFVMPRPKYHFGTGRKAGVLKSDAPKYHTVKPDATKLLRSTEDALTGIVWNDDASVAVQKVTKRYAQPGEYVGALIHVEELQ